MKNKIVNTEIYRHKNEQGTVTLKSRKNGNNPESLFLEIYEKATQKRHLEFLNLYLTGNETLDVQIKANALSRCASHTFESKKSDNLSFTDYCREYINRIDVLKSRKNPKNALNRLHEYTRSDNVPFSKVNERLLMGFRKWLMTKAINRNTKKVTLTISKATADILFACIMSVATRAQKKGYISTLAFSTYEIPSIGRTVNPPVTFTEEEIKRLQGTPYAEATETCKALMLQFACGQRWGDIKVMTWEQIVLDGEVYKIILKQEKTDKILPSFITRGLIDWIGEGKERNGRIFTNIGNDCTVRSHLNKWCKKAGIEKHVGTHTMRRSRATILYKKDVPLYTISKILGQQYGYHFTVYWY